MHLHLQGAQCANVTTLSLLSQVQEMQYGLACSK